MTTEKCTCFSSWKMPRLTIDIIDGKKVRVCSKCGLKRGKRQPLSEVDQMDANAEINMPDPTDY
jgi:hypothetical protein